jgi:NADH dehydrogenase [ubiquinone] 1 alpha subcomplex assembly factor 5
VTNCVDPRDISNLMSRAGFTLLTVDVDEVSIGYPSMWELLDDLRDMGENNAIIGRCALYGRSTRSQLTTSLSRHILHRDTLAAASAIYKGRL